MTCNLCRVSRAWITPLTLVLGLCGTAATTADAGAQAEAAIAWRAPAGCPASDTVRERVLALLASDTGRRVELSARGEIQSSGTGYVLNLAVEVDGHRAQRSLRGDDCAALTETGAWLIALAVDPSLIEKQPPPTDEKPAPEETVEQDADEDVPTQASNGASVARRLEWRGGLFAGAYQAALPALQASLGARLGATLGPIYGELAFLYLWPRELDLTVDAEGSLASQLLRARGCVEWGEGFRIGPCAALTVARTAGELSSGARSSSPGQALWLSGGGAVQIGVRVGGPLEVLLDAGLDLALSPRPRFEVGGVGTVATGRLVSVHTSLGLGVRY